MKQGDNELQMVDNVKEIELSMTLAMQFYLGYFDDASGNYDTRGGRLISLAGNQNLVTQEQTALASMDAEVQANAAIVNKNYEHIVRIIWWINKAISFIRPYVGLCVRWVNI